MSVQVGSNGVQTWKANSAKIPPPSHDAAAIRTIRQVADYYRGRLRELPFDEPSIEDAGAEVFVSQHSDFEGEIDRTRTTAAIQETMSELPELHRAALLWRYWDGCSASEMAAASGKTAKAIERILSRARADFAQRWSEKRTTQIPSGELKSQRLKPRVKHG